MSKPATSKSRLFKNVSWLFGGKTAASALTALQTVILARILGVTDYGLLTLVIAYVDIMNQFFDFRVWETATKYIGTFWAKNEREKARAMIKLSYIIDISSGFLAMIIAIVTAKLVSSYFIHSPEAYYLIYIYALSLLIDTANTTSYAILRVFDKFRTIAYLSSIHQFIRLGLVLVALFLGAGIKGVLFTYVISSFIGFAIRMVVLSKTIKENKLERWWNADLGLIREHWKGIAWFLGNTSITATLKMGGDNYFGVMALGYFAGKDAVAYYKVAKSSVKVMTRLMDPLYEAIYPELVRILSVNTLRDFSKLLKIATKNLMKVTIPAAVLIIVFADYIIRLVFGTDYLPASDALKIVAIAVIVNQLTFWINPALLALGKPGLRTISGIISIGSYIALLLLLVPKYSYVGAAYAFLGYSIVKAIVATYAFKISLDEKKKIDEVSISESFNKEI